MTWKDILLIDDILREKSNAYAVGNAEYSNVKEYYEDVLKEYIRLKDDKEI